MGFNNITIIQDFDYLVSQCHIALSSSSGLSSGAKAGIGIAVAILVISIIIAAWIFRRRRGARQPQMYSDQRPTQLLDMGGRSSQPYDKVDTEQLEPQRVLRYPDADADEIPSGRVNKERV